MAVCLAVEFSCLKGHDPVCLSVCLPAFFMYCYYSMPHYTVILHALLNLIFSFTVAFNTNKIILGVIYIRNVNNNILTSKAYN
jgi:hypothetical protein